MPTARFVAALLVAVGGALGSPGCDHDAPPEDREPASGGGIAVGPGSSGVAAVREESSGPAVAEPPQVPSRPSARAFEPAEDLGGAPEGFGVPVGTPAPDATVDDIDGEPVSLATLYARGPTMLVFYRGGWCPFCNFQIRELTEHHAEFGERGVQLVLVSVDRVEEAARTNATHDIPFPVLSDPDLRAHRAYRVLQEVDEDTRVRYTQMGIDLEAASGREHHTIAVPSVFLVREGRVAFQHVEPDYRTRPTVEQLLGVLDDL